MLPGRFLTSLVLASSFLLVLPRGWCCIVAALGAKAQLTKRCCCQPPEGFDPHVPAQPKPVKPCPCAERNTITPEHPDLPPAKLLPYDVPAAAAAPLPHLCPFVEPLSSWSAHGPPLQILNCIWLC